MEYSETNRLSRLTAILIQLQTKRIVTASELSQKFQVSKRTIYRDIKALEKSGVPILTEEGKGYTLMPGYQLPPVMFTEEEANALCEQIAEQMGWEEDYYLMSAVHKLGSMELCQDIMKFLDELPPEDDILPENDDFRWETEQEPEPENVIEDDFDDLDDDEDDDHPNIVYVRD